MPPAKPQLIRKLQVSSPSLQSQRHLLRDFTVICCNEQHSLPIYIGLGGSNTASLPPLSAPKDQTRPDLSPQASTLLFTVKRWMRSKIPPRKATSERTTRRSMPSHTTRPCAGSSSPCPEYAWPTNKSLSVRFKSLENQSTDELRQNPRICENIGSSDWGYCSCEP